MPKPTALRPDLKLIADLIPVSARVMDVGCGEGELLQFLEREKQVDGRGIELSQKKVSKSVTRGLSVIQGDADTDLVFYPDKSFHYAVMTESLQMTKNPKAVLEQLTRIAEHTIVSFPNFGYWRNRFYLLFHGEMPVTESLSFEWYETPNIHFCTLRDFLRLCNELSCTIEQSFTMSSKGTRHEFKSVWAANILGEQAIFLLKKSKDAKKT